MRETYEKLLNTKFNPKFIAFIFVFALIYSLSGIACSGHVNDTGENGMNRNGTTSAPAAERSADSVGANSDDSLGHVNMMDGIDTINDVFASGTSQDSAAPYAATQWDEKAYPEYYRVDGKAIIAYDVRSGNGGIVYNGLDDLGRTTWAAGYITSDMRAAAKARGRQDFNSDCDKITGWGHNSKVTIPSANGTKDYNGYMFNRSHLIADSLGGDPIRENLVTGTRCQNVGNNDNNGGMAYAEELARNYLDKHDGYIYYAATPVYVGNELVPRSVYVDIRSDDGSIDEHIEVFNVAKGYTIDYATGTFSKN